MTDSRILQLSSHRPPPDNMVDRARNGRRAALAQRTVNILRATAEETASPESTRPETPHLIEMATRITPAAPTLVIAPTPTDCQSSTKEPET